jgi:hypothetical protein
MLKCSLLATRLSKMNVLTAIAGEPLRSAVAEMSRSGSKRVTGKAKARAKAISNKFQTVAGQVIIPGVQNRQRDSLSTKSRGHIRQQRFPDPSDSSTILAITSDDSVNHRYVHKDIKIHQTPQQSSQSPPMIH